MALENCSGIIVKMQEGQGHGIDSATSQYFDGTFKAHFRLLERQIHSSWRLHKAYYEAQSELCLTTSDPNESQQIVTAMLTTIKGKTCSLPVKRLICEKLALMISTRQNY